MVSGWWVVVAAFGGAFAGAWVSGWYVGWLMLKMEERRISGV